MADVAVCVPAHGAVRSLVETLESVALAIWGLDAMVCVAVDGPDPALEAEAARWGATTVVLPTNSGSYAARNAAVDALPPDVRLVLFTDSGLAVDNAWASAHVEALEEGDLSGGPVVCVCSTPPTPTEWVDAHRHFNQRHNVERLGFSVTANLGVRRRVLDRVRFNGELRSGGDFEFGQRARAAGFSITYTELAVVRHPARSTYRALAKKVDRIARGAARLLEEGHRPEARRDRTKLKPVAAARAVYPGLPWHWFARVWLIDRSLSALYLLRVPGAIWPAVTARWNRIRPRL